MKNCDHVGAVPQWTFAVSVEGLKISANPISTSRSCVAKSISARKMFSFADSWMPTTLRATRKTITRMPPMMSHGFSFSGSQKIDR